jgi:hypothetical protein
VPATRIGAIALIGFWVWQLVVAAGQPTAWRPPRSDQFPIPVTRNRYLAGAVIGIIVGLALFAISFLIEL